MKQKEFLSALSAISGGFDWEEVNGRMVSNSGNRRYNPVTAVCESLTGAYYPDNKRGTLSASRKLGLSLNLALDVYKPSSNRGHAQVLRGKVNRAVFTS